MVMVPAHYGFHSMAAGAIVDKVQILKDRHGYKYEDPEVVSVTRRSDLLILTRSSTLGAGWCVQEPSDQEPYCRDVVWKAEPRGSAIPHCFQPRASPNHRASLHCGKWHPRDGVLHMLMTLACRSTRSLTTSKVASTMAPATPSRTNGIITSTNNT